MNRCVAIAFVICCSQVTNVGATDVTRERSELRDTATVLEFHRRDLGREFGAEHPATRGVSRLAKSLRDSDAATLAGYGDSLTKQAFAAEKDFGSYHPYVRATRRRLSVIRDLGRESDRLQKIIARTELSQLDETELAAAVRVLLKRVEYLSAQTTDDEGNLRFDEP